MKTCDVKIDKHYLYKGEIRRVLKQIPGNLTNKPNMQSGMLCTGFKRTTKKFLLDNDEIVFAKQLTEIKNETI